MAQALELSMSSPFSFNSHHDIFLEILGFLANMNVLYDLPPAIDTLRHVSQVCSTWRYLPLGSPKLWASVLNLNRLRQSSTYWRDTVLTRAQQSPLHIKASLIYDQTKTEKTRQFVVEQWGRIRDLDLVIELKADNLSEAKEWMTLFSSSSDMTYLRIMSSMPAIDLFPFNFRHLVALELWDDLSYLRIPGLLRPSIAARTTSKISIPTLKRIEIIGFQAHSSSLIRALLILRQIVPADGCLLNFRYTTRGYASRDSLDAISKLVPIVLPKFAHHARQYVRSSPLLVLGCGPKPPDVDIQVEKGNLLFQILYTDISDPLGRSGGLRFSLRFKDLGQLPNNLFMGFMSCLESLQFYEVKVISLQLDLMDEGRLITALQDLSHAFPSLSHIKMHQPTLSRYVNMSKKLVGRVLFPSLKRIISRDHAVSWQKLEELRQVLSGAD